MTIEKLELGCKLESQIREVQSAIDDLKALRDAENIAKLYSPKLSLSYDLNELQRRQVVDILLEQERGELSRLKEQFNEL